MTAPDPAAPRLLETLRHEPGRGAALAGAHLRRMARSAAALGYPFDPLAAPARLRDATRGRDGPARVRLLLSPDGTLAVECSAIPSCAEPVHVRVAAEPVDSRDPRLRHKTTDRSIYAARLAAHPDCDDVLLINERGELTESTIANLVVQLGGRLWTPPLAAGLLPGVFRGLLLRQGRIRERVLAPAELPGAETIYLINSLRRWRRAVLVR